MIARSMSQVFLFVVCLCNEPSALHLRWSAFYFAAMRMVLYTICICRRLLFPKVHTTTSGGAACCCQIQLRQYLVVFSGPYVAANTER